MSPTSAAAQVVPARRYPTSARSKPASRAPGPPATMPPWARRCRSSARRCARRSTCVRDKGARRGGRQRQCHAGGGAALVRGRLDGLRAALCSNAAASARRPSGSRSSSARPMPRRCLSPTPASTRWFRPSASCSQPDQDTAAAELVRVCKPGGKIGLANWTPDGFIGQLFKTIGKYLPPPAGRQVAGALGHRRAHHRIFRRAGLLDPARAARLRVSLPLCSALARRIQDLLRPAPEDVRRPRPRDADGADGRSVCIDQAVQPLRRQDDGRTERIPRGCRHSAVMQIARCPLPYSRS